MLGFFKKTILNMYLNMSKPTSYLSVRLVASFHFKETLLQGLIYCQMHGGLKYNYFGYFLKINFCD